MFNCFDTGHLQTSNLPIATSPKVCRCSHGGQKKRYKYTFKASILTHWRTLATEASGVWLFTRWQLHTRPNEPLQLRSVGRAGRQEQEAHHYLPTLPTSPPLRARIGPASHLCIYSRRSSRALDNRWSSATLDGQTTQQNIHLFFGLSQPAILPFLQASHSSSLLSLLSLE